MAHHCVLVVDAPGRAIDPVSLHFQYQPVPHGYAIRYLLKVRGVSDMPSDQLGDKLSRGRKRSLSSDAFPVAALGLWNEGSTIPSSEEMHSKPAKGRKYLTYCLGACR